MPNRLRLLLLMLFFFANPRAERACSLTNIHSIVSYDARLLETFLDEVQHSASILNKAIGDWQGYDWIVTNTLQFSDLQKLRGFDFTNSSCAKDPLGSICQSFNQSYFQDTSKGRPVEIFVPGWARTYSFDHERVAHAVLTEGISESEFVTPLANGWCNPVDISLTAFCSANFPACPPDTLNNPVGFSEWMAQNGTLVGSGPKMCPKFCLQPALWMNNVIDAEIGATQPIWVSLQQLANRYEKIGVYWYWYGASTGLCVYAPSLEEWGGFGAFVPWDFT